MNPSMISEAAPPAKTGSAIVFGATGVTGWALCRALLSHKELGDSQSKTFSMVIGVCQQPIEGVNMFIEDRNFQLIDGVDLRKGEDEVTNSLKDVKGIEHVSHVFYVASRNSPSDGMEKSKSTNVAMIQSAVRAVERLSEDFKVMVMQTSINVYGIFASLQGGSLTCPSPLVESAGRTPSPYREMDLHYAQCDEVARLNKGKKWSWFEVRPDAVIGYVPRRHEHNFTLSLGLYFSMYAHLHGPGAKVRFPGTSESYRCKFSMVSQEQVANFSTHLATHYEELKSGEAYNISNGDILSWSILWPEAASRFGLKGVGPEGEAHDDDAMGTTKETKDWSWPFDAEKDVENFEDSNQIRKGWAGMLSEVCFVNTMRPAVDRILSLDKARKAGFQRRDDTLAAFDKAWELFRNSRIIP